MLVHQGYHLGIAETYAVQTLRERLAVLWGQPGEGSFRWRFDGEIMHVRHPDMLVRAHA